MSEIRKPNRRPHSTSTRIDPVEEALVRTIHRAVGGPAKLSTYDDPADVRDVVLRALAAEQRSPADKLRVDRGDLSPLERRVVRTVTNRGAAVRSRMRQRRELQRLRDELRAKDARLQEVEAKLAAICAQYGIASSPPKTEQTPAPSYAKTEDEPALVDDDGFGMSDDGELSYHSSSYSGSSRPPIVNNSCAASSMDSLLGGNGDHGFGQLSTSLDCHVFGNLIDPLS